MERCYWHVNDPGGQVAVGLGLGQYRCAGVLDAVLYLTRAGEQRVLRLSRHLSEANFADPRLGPLELTVTVPLREWRLRLGENPSGITLDVRFVASADPVAFSPFDFRGEDDHSLYTHFVQLGCATGAIEIDGVAVAEGNALPTIRDRSWGVRRARERQGLHLWLQHEIEGVRVNLIYNEARDGSAIYMDGVVDADGSVARIVAIGHDLEVDGSRDICGGGVEMRDQEGRVFSLSYERLLSGYVGGVGYGGWAGVDRGEFFMEHETMDLNQPLTALLAAQPMLLFDHLCRVRIAGHGEAVGSFQAGITRSTSYTYRARGLPKVETS
jgi:hypothetical protein